MKDRPRLRVSRSCLRIRWTAASIQWIYRPNRRLGAAILVAGLIRSHGHAAKLGRWTLVSLGARREPPPGRAKPGEYQPL